MEFIIFILRHTYSTTSNKGIKGVDAGALWVLATFYGTKKRIFPGVVEVKRIITSLPVQADVWTGERSSVRFLSLWKPAR